MDQNQIDLTICQDCHSNPSVYGDGITWARCSSCQLKFTRGEQKVEPSQPEPVQKEEGFKHEVKKDLVSIILPVYMKDYTLFHYTGNCIGSVREHTPSEAYELIVIDNGSPTQPPELDSYYANKVIKNDTNLGVTKAWNQGIRASVGEYIVLLNNDVQVFSHWWVTMKAMLELANYDLVMAHPMYSQTEPFARAVESKKIFDKYTENKTVDLQKSISDFKDFSCVMIKRSLLDEIGLFDEQFFNYCSDSDFFKRMEEAGKKWCCCEAVATSHISDATGFAIPETPHLMNKDKETYAQKWERPAKERAVKNKKGELYRTPETGDMIFYVDHLSEVSKYHHIKDPDTLHALGFEFGDEETIPMDQLVKERKAGEELGMENYQKYV